MSSIVGITVLSEKLCSEVGLSDKKSKENAKKIVHAMFKRMFVEAVSGADEDDEKPAPKGKKSAKSSKSTEESSESKRRGRPAAEPASFDYSFLIAYYASPKQTGKECSIVSFASEELADEFREAAKNDNNTTIPSKPTANLKSEYGAHAYLLSTTKSQKFANAYFGTKVGDEEEGWRIFDDVDDFENKKSGTKKSAKGKKAKEVKKTAPKGEGAKAKPAKKGKKQQVDEEEEEEPPKKPAKKGKKQAEEEEEPVRKPAKKGKKMVEEEEEEEVAEEVAEEEDAEEESEDDE